MTSNYITNKGQLLMQSLTNFFTSNSDNIDTFIKVTSNNSNVSLRVIDWFVTNYSREFDISCKHAERCVMFSVHDAYKSQLKAYSKRQFDPFCRRTRINFYYAADKKVVTTVGQLNFFRWAIESGVLSHIYENRVKIEKHMKTHVRRTRSIDTKCEVSSINVSSDEDEPSTKENTIKCSSKTKRKISTITAKRTMCKQHMEMTVYFT